MPKLSPIKGQKLIKILTTLGFKKIRQEASHARLEHPDGRKTTVPIHAGEKVGKGLLSKILRDAGISRREWEKLR